MKKWKRGLAGGIIQEGKLAYAIYDLLYSTKEEGLYYKLRRRVGAHYVDFLEKVAEEATYIDVDRNYTHFLLGDSWLSLKNNKKAWNYIGRFLSWHLTIK